jgi:broad specificity phosphatase PhoE
VSSPAHLFLIRHAETDCGSNGRALLCGSHDADLSEQGRRQVALLRARLAAEGAFAALYSSPLRRAVATAQAAPPPLLSSLRPVRSLAEIHCGEVEGQSFEDIRKCLPEYWLRNEAQADDLFAWPGGETYRLFRRRVLRALRAIAEKHAGQSVLVFTHAGVVNQVLGFVAGQSAARWENFRPANTAITELLWSGDTGQVLRFDDRSHLL